LETSAREALEIASKAASINVPLGEVEKAARLYAALKKLAERHKLDAFTIKCFDLIKLSGVTACLPLALLNTRAYPAGCEGDVPLLVSMAIGEKLSEGPAFMGNIAYVEDKSLYIVHCTSALVGPFELYTHFESGKNVGVRVQYPADKTVTVYRVSPLLDSIRVGVGVIEEHPEWSRLWCRTQIKIRLENPWKLIEEPMGTHYALILGDYSEELELLGAVLDMKVEHI